MLTVAIGGKSSEVDVGAADGNEIEYRRSQDRPGHLHADIGRKVASREAAASPQAHGYGGSVIRHHHVAGGVSHGDDGTAERQSHPTESESTKRARHSAQSCTAATQEPTQ